MRQFTSQRFPIVKAEDLVGYKLVFYDISASFPSEFGEARRITVSVDTDPDKRTMLTSANSPLAKDVAGMFQESAEPFEAVLTTDEGKRGRAFYCLEPVEEPEQVSTKKSTKVSKKIEDDVPF